MKVINKISTLREALRTEKAQAKHIALVPTMGNLHDGHLSLVDKARQVADCVVASIFVNPMQFGANEDLDNYPRTLAEDQEKLIEHGTNYLFTPDVAEIYPTAMALQSQIEVPDTCQFELETSDCKRLHDIIPQT